MYINPTFIENLKYSDALPEYWIISIVIGLISWLKMMICLRFPHVYDLETQSNRFAKYLRVRAKFYANFTTVFSYVWVLFRFPFLTFFLWR